MRRPGYACDEVDIEAERVRDLRESLLREAAALPVASPSAVEAFAHEEAELVARVRSARGALSGAGAIGTLAGSHDVERDHAQFMRRLLLLGDYRLLVAVLPWIYMATRARGLRDEDNRLMADLWLHAMGLLLPGREAGPISELYRWMRDRHEEWIRLAGTEARPAPQGSAVWRETRAELTDDLARGDQLAALSLAQRFVADPPTLRDLYTEAVTPAMYEIGRRWETGELSVAEEHRASEITSRIVDICYPALTQFRHTKGRALVTAAPGEQHSLGARIVADLLEADGWGVTYIGASAPAEDIVRLAGSLQPHLIGISVAIPSNLPQLAQLIRDLRRLPDPREARVMVGGWLQVLDPDLWRLLGADAGGVDAGGAVAAAAALWEGKGPGD